MVKILNFATLIILVLLNIFELNASQQNAIFRRLRISQVPMELTKQNIDEVMASFGLELEVSQIREKLYSDNLEIIDDHTLTVGIVLSIAKELPGYRGLGIKEWVKENLGVDLNQEQLRAIDKVTDRLLEENERLFEEIKRVIKGHKKIEDLSEQTAYDEMSANGYVEKKLSFPYAFEFWPFAYPLVLKLELKFGFDGKQTYFSSKFGFVTSGSSINNPAKTEIKLSGKHLFKEFFTENGREYVRVFVISDQLYKEMKNKNIPAIYGTEDSPGACGVLGENRDKNTILIFITREEAKNRGLI